MMKSFLVLALADLGRLDDARTLAHESLAVAEKMGLLYLRTEALRGLAYVHFKLGEFEEVVTLSERIIELTEGTDARNSKLWAGPIHIQALLAMGRPEEASARLAAYAEMVGDCQSPYFSREVSRLEGLVK